MARNYDSQAIRNAYDAIKRTFGTTVVYRSGRWEYLNAQGQWLPVGPAAGAYQQILDQAQAAYDVKKTQDATADDAGDADLFRNPVLHGLRAVLPAEFRPLLRRAVAGIRAAQAMGPMGRVASMGAGAVGGAALGGSFGGVAGAVGGGLGGLVGGILGPVGGAIGGALGAAAGKLVGMVVESIGKNLGAMSHAGAQIVDSLYNGLRGAMGGLVSAGVEVAGVIVKGLLSVLGPSGAAIGRLMDTVTKGVGTIFGHAFDALGKVAHAGGAVAGLGAGVGSAALGLALLGPLGVIAGPIVGAVAAKLVAAVTGMLGELLGAFGKLFGELGHMVAGLAQTVIDVLKDVVDATMAYSKRALDIAQKSGATIGQAAQASNLLAGFGVNAADVSGLTRNAWQQRMVGRAWGVTGTPGSAENLASFRGQYQRMAAGGPFGLMRAQAMAGALGYESLIPMANLPQGIFNRQMQRSQGMQAALGLNPQQIAGFGQDLSSLMATVGQFVELLKVRIGGELLPYLTNGLNLVIKYVSAHAGDIAAAIRTGIDWLAFTMPGLVLAGLATVVRGFGTFLGALAMGAQYVADNAVGILGAFDRLIDGVQAFIHAVAEAWDWINTWILPNAANANAAASLGLAAPSNLAVSYSKQLAGAAGTAAGTLGGWQQNVNGMADTLDRIGSQLPRDSATLHGTLNRLNDRLDAGININMKTTHTYAGNDTWQAETATVIIHGFRVAQSRA